ncbi:SEL1-like repeat protein [Moraxella bovis]|uniref:SEL1-like repeat protein n=1 Tax=Moraxella bovis TaxID=476 RepID=A0AAX3EVE8_MORBO|nr:SEL1-like repeat protein [Moraxella bovis]OOR88928.1 hypothetical protein B0182_08485 [Moraxella bovis]UYZ68251.1 SEL1-like repeat protein [Moraxella bovis]UYZ73439.1 SEL1-like repeat protein [Moraxella bovis]UYZ76022.1 SEL1-like repeat protein [Moraxella bovis]UYZ78025.1 SEL1-like repeat protein [Moraxella bovis]
MSDNLKHYKSLLEQVSTNPTIITQLEMMAENDDGELTYILGWCYFKGEYLPKDLTKSMYWLEKAKTLGDDRAEELMVYCRFLQIAEWSRDDRKN